MERKIATAEEVKARWAYGEITSPRFGKKFVNIGPQHLHDSAHGRIPFSDVHERDWPALVEMLRQARNERFVSAIDECANIYECQEWTKAQLAGAYAVSGFNPPHFLDHIPYMSFYNSPPLIGSDGKPQSSDPRFRAASIDPNTPFVQDEPVIMVRDVNHRYILLEGYVRSILFMRSPNLNTRLLAWVPTLD
jgi:hypothetical protein